MAPPRFTLEEKLALFFSPVPTSPLRGTLRMVRDDVETCRSAKAWWPEVMCLFAGIDLLALCYAGGRVGRDGDRFREFLKDYFGLNHHHRKAIYKLRCAVVHSYGWYAGPRGRSGGAYGFQLDQTPGPLLERIGTRTYRLHIPELLRQFEQAAADYEADLRAGRSHRRTGASLRVGFSRLFLRYGLIRV